ncbi:hypothetical protein SLS53_005733 [Cytospora paraplurivora]|uniref:Rhodopsin domain-containing protein n=1 Tax=Cytospora paraplurivora TaxID=2898453 RepID=A0AAN9U4Z3_9PEZI
MVDAKIEAVFGPLPAGTDLTADTRPGNNAAVAILLVIATISVVLRMISKYITHTGIKYDDYTIILALILFVYTFIYAAAVSTTKISILFFYYRIFQKQAGRLFLISLGIGGFMAAAYPIIIWTTMASACRPASYFWEEFTGVEGSCPVSIKDFFLALGVINMINDIIVLMIPIPQIWKLQMSVRKRLGVIGILTLGSFVCVASIVRIYYLSSFMNAVDVTYLMGPIFIWSSVEPSVGILGACMPTFPPLIRLAKTKATQGYGNSDSYSSTPANTSVWSARRRQNRFDEDELQLTNIERGSDTNFNGKGIMVQSEIDQCSSVINKGD